MGQRRRNAGAGGSRRRLRWERLEDRRLLAVATVTTLADTVDFNDGVTSLREAIFATNTVAGADTIEFDPALFADGPGEISLANGEFQITEALVIAGPGTDLLTINAQQLSRIFNFTATTGDFSITGLTITGGKSTGSGSSPSELDGGAIRSLSDGTLQIRNSIVTGNSTSSTSARGGGIFAVGTLQIVDSTVAANTAGSRGGAAFGNRIEIVRSTISNNRTLSTSIGGGGGVFGAVDVTVQDSEVTENQTNRAFAPGGGIFSFGSVSILSSSVSGNRTLDDRSPGGGVYSVGIATVDDSTIANNSTSGVDSPGGGIYSKSFLTLKNSTLTGNSTTGDESEGGGAAAVRDLAAEHIQVFGNSASGSSGGGLWSLRSITISDSGIVNNTAGERGGGIAGLGSSSPISLIGSVVSENVAQDRGGGIYSNASGNTLVTLESCEILDNRTLGVEASGGGIFANGSVIGLNSAIERNSTAGWQSYGGGIHAFDVTLSGTTIRDNWTEGSESGGGGVNARNSVSLTDSLVSGNHVQGSFGGGGGIRATKNVSLVRTTVSGNYVSNGGGGGISSAEQFTAVDCDFVGNFAIGNVGGAIGARFVSITGCLLEGNYTEGNQAGGGAIWAQQGLNIESSLISGNSTRGRSSSGGGVRVLAAPNATTITNSVISGNSTLGDEAPGGGIASPYGNVKLIGTLVTGNHTAGFNSRGGGIAADGVELVSCTVSGNYTSGMWAAGGGIYSEPGTFNGGALITNSTISGNYTTNVNAHGGGIRASEIDIRNSTVAENRTLHPTANGGGLWSDTTGSNRFLIENSIVAGNLAGGTNPDFRTALSFNLAVRHSLIGDRSGVPLVEAPLGTPDANGNLVGGPINGVIDPMLGPLTFNGGPVLPGGSKTLTHALLPGSPAIDTGDPAAVVGVNGVTAFDQRGEPFGRIADGDGVDGARIDLGAYERQPGEVFQLVVDTLADELDGDYSAGDFSLREAIAIANLNPGSDTISFAEELWADGPATILLEQGELAITEAVTIDGPGAELLTIDAQHQSRIFHITEASGAVTLRGMSVIRGRTIGDNVDQFGEFSGGGIRSATGGRLTLDGMVVDGSSTAGKFAWGGGIFARSLTVQNSRITNNSTNGGSANGAGIAVFAIHSNGFAIEDCQIVSNVAHDDSANGGGVFSYSDVAVRRGIFRGNTSGARGGGIASFGAVDLDDCIIEQNQSDVGGGVYSQFTFTALRTHISGNVGGGVGSADYVTLIECIVSDNVNHAFRGGGIYTSQGLFLLRSTITGNHTTADAGRGGGAYASEDIIATGCTIEGNYTKGELAAGGGLVSQHGKITITGSTISNNWTEGRVSEGGGIYSGIMSDGVIVIDSTVSDNYTLGDDAQGGGIHTTRLRLTQATVSGNSTFGLRSEGGGISAGIANIDFSTITRNHTYGASARGGGASIASPIVFASIIAGNTSATGSPDLNGQGQLRLSLIGHNDGTGRSEAPIGSPNVFGSIIGGPTNGPIDPMLGLLTGNGGPTATHSPLPGSPALDFIDPTIMPFQGIMLPQYDQRGTPWTRTAGERFDMGAVEAQVNPLPGDYNFDGIVDAIDYTVWRNTVGSAVDLRADGSGEVEGLPDGVVDGFDYAWWKAKYGNVLVVETASGGGGLAPAAVMAHEMAVELRSADGGERSAPASGPRAMPRFDLSASVAAQPRSRDITVRPAAFVTALHDDALLAWLTSRREERRDVGESALDRDEGEDETSDEAAIEGAFAALGLGF